MDLLQPPPKPKSKLGIYRLLSPNAGVHVSPLQLGGGNIGDQWGQLGMGDMDKVSSFKLLDAYYDNGGNFIDTANSYQNESSERFIGEWAEKRGIRDQLFIATKYGNSFKQRADVEQQAFYTGNSAKALHISVEASLKKLRTTYIDLLYIHFYDYATSVQELMKALHALILQGKVLYLGVSNAPAWVVSKANQYARDHALTPFVVYQGAWNVMDQSEAFATGMALAPWNVLAGGKIRTDAEEERRRKTGEKGRTLLDPNWERNEQEKKVCAALEKVAAEVGAKHINSIAIAYLLQKTTYVFPILGGRKVEHLLANLESLEISLSDEQMKFLESIVHFEPGYPHHIIGDGTDGRVFKLFTHIDKKPVASPLRPSSDDGAEGMTMASLVRGNVSSSS
ncbi:hypothetical protein NLJ89_g7821 [Agrocybe chaxingu]|uniref:NADP-dependent oxidoreductase domain-containing protein n=1 Tax=Agrocybe chaxingu TaxID=84603 RepID=A0A9W8MTB4_9AGAR|nr:hypothetical protein NLJ89_g7821 [Agrocybe chaxingu]